MAGPVGAGGMDVRDYLPTRNTRHTRAKPPQDKLSVMARRRAVRPVGAEGTAATTRTHRMAEPVSAGGDRAWTDRFTPERRPTPPAAATQGAQAGSAGFDDRLRPDASGCPG